MTSFSDAIKQGTRWSARGGPLLIFRRRDVSLPGWRVFEPKVPMGGPAGAEKTAQGATTRRADQAAPVERPSARSAVHETSIGRNCNRVVEVNLAGRRKAGDVCADRREPGCSPR